MSKLILSVVFLIIITIAGFAGMFGDWTIETGPVKGSLPSESTAGTYNSRGSPVQTTSGLVYGHTAPDAPEVSEYLGIPYAMPPLGALRFAPPVKYIGNGEIEGSTFVRTQSVADSPPC